MAGRKIKTGKLQCLPAPAADTDTGMHMTGKYKRCIVCFFKGVSGFGFMTKTKISDQQFLFMNRDIAFDVPVIFEDIMVAFYQVELK